MTTAGRRAKTFLTSLGPSTWSFAPLYRFLHDQYRLEVLIGVFPSISHVKFHALIGKRLWSDHQQTNPQLDNSPMELSPTVQCVNRTNCQWGYSRLGHLTNSKSKYWNVSKLVFLMSYRYVFNVQLCKMSKNYKNANV